MAALPLGLVGLGFLAMLLPAHLVRTACGGRDPTAMAMVPLASGLTLLGLMLAGMHSADAVRALWVERWERAPARILHSELIGTLQARSTTQAWRPDVSYRYQYGSRTYLGYQIAFRPLASSDRAGTEAWLRRHYPVGAQVQAYVDPASPHRAVLEPGGSPWSWMLAGTGLVLATAGLCLLRMAWREYRAAPPRRSRRRRK